MYSPYRIRLAILTSLGLVPLGCLPDRDTTTIEPSATDGSVDAGTLSTANSHCGTASCQTEDNSQKEQSQAMLSCGEGRELTGVLSSVEICGNRDGSREPLEACANDIVRGPLLKDPFRQTTASDAGAPVSTVANVPGADAGRTASGSITWTDAGTGGAGAPTEVLEIEPRCQTDADCGTGSVCNCGISNICLPAECQTDGDCDGDLKCVLTARAPQCYFSVEYFYACQAPKDECLTSCDTGSCLLRDGYRQCAEISWGGACGRPFLVEGQARMAQLECNSDWCKKTPQLNNDFLPFDAELSREEIGNRLKQTRGNTTLAFMHRTTPQTT